MSKIERLAEIEGFNSADTMLLFYGLESVVPGICVNDDCEFTADVEPDCTDGYCEDCETETVKSCMILGEMI